MVIKKDSAKPRDKQASRETGKSTTTKQVRKTTSPSQKVKAELPIIGIGASAGGLEALQELFTNMPSDTGLGFVVVPHLDPTHTSIMPELLQRYTDMPVYQAKDRVKVKPDTVYVIPPNKNIGILHRHLVLLEPAEPHGFRFPIDFFLRSLAQDQGELAIGIILSGSGTDGTLGLRTIKVEGGLAIVQEPGSAKHDGMPRHAIDSGPVDFILPPSKMPAQLVSFVSHFSRKRIEKRPLTTDTLSNYLEKIFLILRQHTKHDFSQYKLGTFNRRIDRRMTVNKIGNIANYVSFLEQHPEEAQALFKDILISVTGFFRDREAFIALKRHMKHLISGRSSTSPIRVWVPGCATGEEAYSITMIVRECLDELDRDTEIQVFATDLDADAIERARTSTYPLGVAADVSQERLNHFFVKTEDAYVIKSEFREMVVFAVQDIIKDPPFSKVDLICCRNLLIYLNADLQARLVPLLHYSLNKDGILFLGSAETVGKFTDLFSALDNKWKIYQRRELALNNNYRVQFAPPASERKFEVAGGEPRSDTVEAFSIEELVNNILLYQYTPACVVVDQKYDVLYVHGQTSRYLELPTGPLKTNILDMAREGLKTELAAALRKAFFKGEETSYHNLQVKHDGSFHSVDLKVSPIVYPAVMQKLSIVMFQTVTSREPEPPVKTKHGRSTRSGKRIAELEQELALTKENLQTTIEEVETSSEELNSANEELQSSNEELQSTNQELETSREQLQSLNEELMTVNAENQGKIDELSKSRDDLQNLLNSTDIATIFLDMNLHIRRFTPAAANIFNVIKSDIGRPIHHVTSNLAYDKLDEDLNEVLDSLFPKYIEVETKEGRSYTLRITPYRSAGNAIEGLVITIVDITEEKKAAQEVAKAKAAQEAREYAESIVDTVREPLIILDADLRIISANRSFYQTFQVTPEESERHLLYELGNSQWDIPRLRELLEEILPKNTTFNDYEVEHNFPTIGKKTMLLNARRVYREANKVEMILLAIEDITERKKA
jgi:two-component system CheB/CheR fusion protein